MVNSFLSINYPSNELNFTTMYTSTNNKSPRYVATSTYYINSSVKAANIKGNIHKLNRAMIEQGVDKEDIQELDFIVKTEEPDFENLRLGEKVNDWILKVFGKVLNGVGTIRRSVSAYLLASTIKKYYGIEDYKY